MSNQSNSALMELNNRLLAGKASLEQSEIDDLLINLRIELSRAESEKQLDSDIEAESWQNIFNGLFSSELSNTFMENMDKDLFFGFGEYLASLSNQSNKKIISIIHNYLNLFRNSTFLQKIYEERRWDKLIHALIVQSNYTFDVLFNQRVNQYKKKSLFSIITVSYTHLDVYKRQVVYFGTIQQSI